MASDPDYVEVPRRDTVVVERSSGGNGGMALLALVLLIVAGIGLFIYAQSTRSSMVRDNAITHAVNQAGSAAKDVGDAAKGAGN